MKYFLVLALAVSPAFADPFEQNHPGFVRTAPPPPVTSPADLHKLEKNMREQGQNSKALRRFRRRAAGLPDDRAPWVMPLPAPTITLAPVPGSGK